MRVNIDGADTGHIMLHISDLLIVYGQRIRASVRSILKIRIAHRLSRSRTKVIGANYASSSSIAECLSDPQVHPEPCEAPDLTERHGRPSRCKVSRSALQAAVPHQSPVEL